MLLLRGVGGHALVALLLVAVARVVQTSHLAGTDLAVDVKQVVLVVRGRVHYGGQQVTDILKRRLDVLERCTEGIVTAIDTIFGFDGSMSGLKVNQCLSAQGK